MAESRPVETPAERIVRSLRPDVEASRFKKPENLPTEGPSKIFLGKGNVHSSFVKFVKLLLAIFRKDP